MAEKEITNGIFDCEIICNCQVSNDIYAMEIRGESIAENVRAGQFVHIKCTEGFEPFLRRPISVCKVNKTEGTFTIYYRLKGLGTRCLSKKRDGDTINIIGPCGGNPFNLSSEYKKIIIVGGGIGVFPLLLLLKQTPANSKLTYLGFKSAKDIILDREFSMESPIIISTEDGTYGEKGYITDKLEEEVSLQKPNIIYACGPTPMLKKVAEIAIRHSIRCQISLEQNMACGIGACLGCATKIKDDNAEKGFVYKHVCKHGPAFWADEAIF